MLTSGSRDICCSCTFRSGRVNRDVGVKMPRVCILERIYIDAGCSEQALL